MWPFTKSSRADSRGVTAFDAGKFQRRLRGVPTTQAAINTQIRAYGQTVLARSRYLAANNSYAAQAKETFVSALVGCGIKPSSLIEDKDLREELQRVWLDWTDEADADGLTDFYGLQAIIAGEMFEAGECFIRVRPRRPEDGLTVPLQLQLLPAEMLPLGYNVNKGDAGRIECGIEFGPIGNRIAYHFLRKHPGDDQNFRADASLYTVVPAEEVLHLFKPMRAGQIRGLPHTLAGIVTAAILDMYEDAELERKRTAALFGGIVTRPATTDEDDPLLPGSDIVQPPSSGPAPTGDYGLEPGGIMTLDMGEDIKWAEPADVGGNFEAFEYRALLKMAAGYGTPYAAMTGDLRQTSYGSIRAGLVEFRRRIEAIQHHVMVFQFCRPIWMRWLKDAVLNGAVPIRPSAFDADPMQFMRTKWITPKWDWIDPLKDLQAERLAVRAGFKSRSDVIEASGYDPEETDARMASDKNRAEDLGLVLDSDAEYTSNAGVTQARPDGTTFVDPQAAPVDPAAQSSDPADPEDTVTGAQSGSYPA